MLLGKIAGEVFIFAKTLAFTATTVGSAQTLVGTAGTDSIATTATTITANAFEGSDDINLGANISGSDIGFGANQDTLTVNAFNIADTVVKLGDGADIVISRTGAATGQNEDVSAGRKPEHGLSQRRIFIHLNFFRRVIMQLLRNSAEASFRDADHYPASFAVGKTSRGMSHRGEVMRISLEIDDSSDLFLVLRVSDNGPGISEAVKTQMSRPGFSTKSGSNRGYGLPAAQALAEVWGGTVSYCDEPRSERSDIDNHLNEDGAQFAVSFPYAQRNRQA